MTFVYIVGGLVLLFFGGEALVRGAVAVARRFHVSPLVIGVTIVGFGTSAPELVVSVEAALSGAPGIAVGNVVGSNICNMMLILGVAGLISPMVVHPMALRRDLTLMVLATVIFVLFGVVAGDSNHMQFGPVEGIAMLALLCVMLAYTMCSDARLNDAGAALHREEADELASSLPARLDIMALAVLGGLGALVAGSHMMVEGATTLARAWGVSDEVIGLTLVAVGTSLPELATSIVAAVRGHSDVCLGNVLGSNIFNLFGIMGVAAIVTPVPIAPKIVDFDFWVMLAMTLALVPLLMNRKRLGRVDGGILVLAYGAYVFAQFLGMGGVMIQPMP